MISSGVCQVYISPCHWTHLVPSRVHCSVCCLRSSTHLHTHSTLLLHTQAMLHRHMRTHCCSTRHNRHPTHYGAVLHQCTHWPTCLQVAPLNELSHGGSSLWQFGAQCGYHVEQRLLSMSTIDHVHAYIYIKVVGWSNNLFAFHVYCAEVSRRH